MPQDGPGDPPYPYRRPRCPRKEVQDAQDAQAKMPRPPKVATKLPPYTYRRPSGNKSRPSPHDYTLNVEQPGTTPGPNGLLQCFFLHVGCYNSTKSSMTMRSRHCSEPKQTLTRQACVRYKQRSLPNTREQHAIRLSTSWPSKSVKKKEKG